MKIEENDLIPVIKDLLESKQTIEFIAEQLEDKDYDYNAEIAEIIATELLFIFAENREKIINKFCK